MTLLRNALDSLVCRTWISDGEKAPAAFDNVLRRQGRSTARQLDALIAAEGVPA